MGCGISHPQIYDQEYDFDLENVEKYSNLPPYDPLLLANLVEKYKNKYILPIETQVPVNFFSQEQQQQQPLSPLSVINTSELMESLHDHHLELDVSGKPKLSYLIVEKQSHNDNKKKKNSTPLWKFFSQENLLAEMDPIVGLTYWKALSLKQSGTQHNIKSTSFGSQSSLSNIDLALALARTQDKIKSTSFGSESCLSNIDLVGTKDKIVLYYTSVRGIRKTYEDCCAVRMIMRGFMVHVEERDISMDSGYKNELQVALKGKKLSLPQVFIRGEHIGGVDDIKRLDESGELMKLLKGFPMKHSGYACEYCGDLRFMPCLNCNGSMKVFEKTDTRLKRCLECKENGLIRCGKCCD